MVQEAKDFKTTPMMAQYLKTKQDYPDCLLFYRMGDFYELFFEDALIASKVLDIVQTFRGKHNGQDIPMCGVPFHAYENYLVRLVKAGYKVAICEQMESPLEAKKRGSTAVVKRDVIRIVTAGTLTEDSLLDAKQHNYIAAVFPTFQEFGVVWADMSTGDFYTQTARLDALHSVLSRFNPSEILVPENLKEKYPNLIFDTSDILTEIPDERFVFLNNKKRLESFYKVQDIEAFGSFTQSEIIAAGILLDYILLTQKGAVPVLKPLHKMISTQFMEIDASTRKSLELTSTMTNDRSAQSLLKTLDQTITAMGGRLLFEYVSSPLLDLEKINDRLDKIDYFFQNDTLRDEIRHLLKSVSDIERSLARLSLEERGGPRDMKDIAQGLSQIPAIRNVICKGIIPHSLKKDLLDMGEHSELVHEIEAALVDKPPLKARDGGFIKQGYSVELDDVLNLKYNTRKILADLQHHYIQMTGINNLKISFNNLQGYYVEIPEKQASLIQEHPEWGFKHRKTLLNSIRFITAELMDLESKINHADEQALLIEMKCFDQLRSMILSKKEEISTAASRLAVLDVASALAYRAELGHWVRPILTDGYDFEIKGGRHPVVEAALQKNHQTFIPNDCTLGEPDNNLWILTGPNMAGKSTFLRQNAQIAVMAQMGSFVPAEYAKIGLIDRLFSRVGASDELAKGRSTFMVEMVEVASILNGATDKSLVILDEVGRGTATFDGLSLAWAVVEYLHDHNKCRGLFATHYHELTALSNRLSGVTLHTMRVKEWQGDIVFLHEVDKGAVNRSYGVHVAKLAGIPEPVIVRAEQVLAQLEEKKQTQKPLFDDLPLFSQVLKTTYTKHESSVEKELKQLDIDSLSPREALNILYQLKTKLEL